MKKLFVFVFCVNLLLISRPSAVSAGKVLPRFQQGGTGKATVKSYSYSITVTPRMISGKKGVKLTLGNLQNAVSVNYVLSYETSTNPEGVAGSITPKGETSSTRELLFGTCSSGVCKYHSGVKNAKLTVTTKLTNGKTSVKRYSIRV